MVEIDSMNIFTVVAVSINSNSTLVQIKFVKLSVKLILDLTTLIALADCCFLDQKEGIFNSITRQQCTRMIFNTLSTDMRRNLSCYPHISAGSESVSSFIPRKWGQAQTVLEKSTHETAEAGTNRAILQVS